VSEHASGTCRYCGCTEEHPCKTYSGGENDTCGWLYGTLQTVCTAPICISNYARDKRALEREIKEMTRKKAPWEIEELIQEKRRKRKRESRLRCKARKAAEAKRKVATV
jgi:hypothetical protein